MNFKKLSVNKLLFGLGILITSGFLIFFVAKIFFSYKTEELSKRIENEQARRRLGRVIIENIGVIEKNFYRIISKPHFVDDEVVILETKNHFNQIRKAVKILKNGGTFVLTTQLNLEVASEVIEKIKYSPHKETYIMEYIELKPKIDVLDKKFSELVELHRKLNQADISHNKQEIEKLSKDIYTFSKIIYSHFTRSQENANHAYYYGTKNLLKLENEVSYDKKQFFLIETFLLLSIGLIVLFFFILIAYRIHLINKDLIESQNETKNAKDHLLILNEDLKKEIVERKLVEEQIIANEQKYRTVADWTYNWEYWISFDNQIIYMSPSVQRLTGYTIDDFQKDKDLLEKIIYPDDFIKWSFHRKESHFTTGSDELSEIEFRILHKDGRIITIMHTCRNIFDENGDHLGIRASNVDITENAHLLDEIVKAKEKAESADKLKSEFLAQMSHEIRTPINSIVSLSYIVEEELSQYADEDTTTCFSLIKNSGDRIIRTVDLILNLSEVTVGTYEKNLNIFNLVEKVLKNLFEEYHPIAKSKNLELEFEDNSVNQLIEADLYTVEQIFIQLLDNAIKYTDSGHIYIRTFLEKEDTIVVEIEDEGIGISEEYLSKLFIPFSQEQMGYTRVYEGNGIGLALVFEYCKLNKATISAKSIKGNGSTFTVRFSKYANK